MSNKIRRYKLLKDLPFAKAGEEFSLHRGGIRDYITLYKNDEEVYQFKVGENISEMFDEWFKEVKEFEQYFTIDILKSKVSEVMKIYHAEWAIKNMKSLGLLFETEEKAEEYLEYLKAKEVIKQDAKGFKPNWNNKDEAKYYGRWNYYHNKPNYDHNYQLKKTTISFRSEKDLRESFAKHPEEWKTYLTYE